jgi:hypothetical protein
MPINPTSAQQQKKQKKKKEALQQTTTPKSTYAAEITLHPGHWDAKQYFNSVVTTPIWALKMKHGKKVAISLVAVQFLEPLKWLKKSVTRILLPLKPLRDEVKSIW